MRLPGFAERALLLERGLAGRVPECGDHVRFAAYSLSGLYKNGWTLPRAPTRCSGRWRLCPAGCSLLLSWLRPGLHPEWHLLRRGEQRTDTVYLPGKEDCCAVLKAPVLPAVGPITGGVL